ncbi:MAG TPA: glucose-1-phosphate adenylyltransferase [Blastocatellia bacterium]|nr:glucose-1-phosphate adenylyltransferase [Blastocatellia bacterium]
MREVMTVILGGGQGQRLFPLTAQRAKPAVPLGGKYRLIDITISNCINSDISKIYILTQFNSASLNRHIFRTYRFSRFTDGFVEILAAEQTPEDKNWFQGTADAVRQAYKHFNDPSIKTFLILSGDHLYRMDYKKFIKHHYETGADLTISVVPMDPENASSFGLLKTNEEGRILEFKEKPKGAELDTMRVNTESLGLNADEAKRKPFIASMGIYVFKKEMLGDLLFQNMKHVDFGKEIIPAALSCCNVQAYLFNGYWEDIGTIKAFYHANIDMTAVIPQFNFYDPNAPIYTRPRFLPGSKLRDCQVNESIVCEGCILDGAILRRSIIGNRSRVGYGAIVEHSMIMGSDYYQSIEDMQQDQSKGVPIVGIGPNTIIRNAIIDKNARIGANVRILNEDNGQNADNENYYIRDGIVIVPKDALIPDGTII